MEVTGVCVPEWFKMESGFMFNDLDDYPHIVVGVGYQWAGGQRVKSVWAVSLTKGSIELENLCAQHQSWWDSIRPCNEKGLLVSYRKY